MCYDNVSKVEFDPNKSAKNELERDLPFEQAADLEWVKAYSFADTRHDYGESRLIALVPMRKRLYVVCYLDRGGVRRIISFRKANNREEKIYEQATSNR